MRKKIGCLKQSLFLWGIIALFSGMAYAGEKTLPKPIFKLTKGQGTEICEAYLQRLNAIEFVDNDPVKGRISEPLLKGFADLKPVPLTAEEIQRMYYKIKSFDYLQDQDIFEKDKEIHKNEVWRIQQGQRAPREIKQYMIDYQKTPFIRYQIMLDMDNDGIPTDTVIKNNNSVYLVDSKLQRIDEARMKAIFANQQILDWPSIRQFPPLASPINIFSFNNKFYFDGFLDLLIGQSNLPIRVDPYVPVMELGVFFHKQQQTYKICEYQWINGLVKELKHYHRK
jgi:hypothetical protein